MWDESNCTWNCPCHNSTFSSVGAHTFHVIIMRLSCCTVEERRKPSLQVKGCSLINCVWLCAVLLGGCVLTCVCCFVMNSDAVVLLMRVSVGLWKFREKDLPFLRPWKSVKDLFVSFFLFFSSFYIAEIFESLWISTCCRSWEASGSQTLRIIRSIASYFSWYKP